MNWKDLLHRYMDKVIGDDYIVGTGSINDEDFTEEERFALKEAAHEICEKRGLISEGFINPDIFKTD